MPLIAFPSCSFYIFHGKGCFLTKPGGLKNGQLVTLAELQNNSEIHKLTAYCVILMNAVCFQIVFSPKLSYTNRENSWGLYTVFSNLNLIHFHGNIFQSCDFQFFGVHDFVILSTRLVSVSLRISDQLVFLLVVWILAFLWRNLLCLSSSLPSYFEFRVSCYLSH